MRRETWAPASEQPIRLDLALRPLQAIAVIAALVLVLSYGFEIFAFVGLIFARLLLVGGLLVAMWLWAIGECLLIMRRQSGRPFRRLLCLLIAGALMTGARLAVLLWDHSAVAGDWMTRPQWHAGWGLLLFLPYSLIFLLIFKSIVDLISLNESIRAQKKEDQLLSMLTALSKTRDTDTGNHILRTQHYVLSIARQLKADGYSKRMLTEKFIDQMFKAAPLHDLGKIAIPDIILLKPGKLDDAEWEVMKTHAAIGASVLATAIENEKREGGQTHEDVLVVGQNIAGGHHEWWDGSGYPQGLEGEEIPLEARIMAIADVYDALVTERPYKKVWTHEQALENIKAQAGIKFDPRIVAAFLARQEEFRAIAEKFRD